MNRSDRRRALREKRMDKKQYEAQLKKFKGKISNEAFDKYFSEESRRLIDQEAEQKVNEQVQKYWFNIEEMIKKAMRENRVSDERVEKIFNRFAQLMVETQEQK